LVLAFRVNTVMVWLSICDDNLFNEWLADHNPMPRSEILVLHRQTHDAGWVHRQPPVESTMGTDPAKVRAGNRDRPKAQAAGLTLCARKRRDFGAVKPCAPKDFRPDPTPRGHPQGVHVESGRFERFGTIPQKWRHMA
jgi:hypothetical protein